MKKTLAIFFVVLFAVNAFAVTSQWQGTEDRSFVNVDNWSASEPFVNSVVVSKSGESSPIMYVGDSLSFDSGKDFYLGGSALGEFTMEGGVLTLDVLEIGCDYWSYGIGYDGYMRMIGGNFTANTTYIGCGNAGELIVTNGNLNAGSALIVGSTGPHSGGAGTAVITITGGLISSSDYIDAGASTSAVFNIDASSTVISSGYFLFRQNADINFTVYEGMSSCMYFSSSNASNYTLEGKISLSFADYPKAGTYNLINFAADLTGLDISSLLSSSSSGLGWQLQIASNGTGGSVLQAVYGAGCLDMIHSGYIVAGDVDGDCDVDFVDFADIASNWLKTEDLIMQGPIGSDNYQQWKVEVIGSEQILYTSPDPDEIYMTTPGIAVCPNGRLVATFQVSGDNVNNIAEVAAGGRGFVYTSDDHGESWDYRTNTYILHARPFVAGNKLYILGHSGDLRIMQSSDWGTTWSGYTELTTGQQWHASATNVWYKDNYVYMVMERYLYDVSDAWRVAELAPVLLRGNTASSLMLKNSWTIASSGAFIDYVDDANLQTLFGLPFYPCYYPDRYYFPNAGSRSFSPMGWLESNVVQITDSEHQLYDATGNTMHIFMRANTGLTNIACVMKATENTDNTITTSFETAPSGKELLYVPMPGGQMRFHIVYDDVTQLYWLLSTQATDSMTKAEYLPEDRFGSPDNERRRLQLHFSKNMFDWCFAGLVAVGETEKSSRHYAAMDIDGSDLVILSRSADSNAKSAHDCNLITFHKVENFRDLVY